MKHTHTHHIKPKHAGGTNDPSNLIELSITEHALAHKALYEQYGKLEDKLAWLMLSRSPEAEVARKQLAYLKYREFLEDPIKKKQWRDKISITLTGRKLSPHVRKLISIGVKRSYQNGKKFYVKPPLDILQQNYYRNKLKMDKARRNSKVWKESVTNLSYRKNHSNIFKGRKITWGNKISKSKINKNYNAKEVIINGVTYDCIAQASRVLNIPHYKIRTLYKKHGKFITIS